MKFSQIEKALDSASLSDEQLALVNRLTRRTLGRDEIFVFSLTLCDNEIDRDGERFTRASLETLAGMFVGKTGVFDHSPKTENQNARIFQAQVEDDTALNSLGEPYCRLRAWAYMLRSPKNEELIFEIDGGIKKEVSVGCAVAKVTCSVCGADQKAAPCTHEKGCEYNGTICHHLLEQPTDAYEWSFVAVPAQKNAGVTKKLGAGCSSAGGGCTELAKLFGQGGGVTLTSGDLAVLKAQYNALNVRAEAGDAYLAELRRETVKLAGIAQPELSPLLAEHIAHKLELSQLDQWREALAKAARKVFPPSPQLVPQKREDNADSEFKI